MSSSYLDFKGSTLGVDRNVAGLTERILFLDGRTRMQQSPENALMKDVVEHRFETEVFIFLISIKITQAFHILFKCACN